MTRQRQGFLRIRGSREHIPLNQILWLEGDGNYTRIHLQHASPALTAKTLTRWNEQLTTFIRANKGALVNPDNILTGVYLSSKEMWLTLTDGTKLPVSRRRIIYIKETLAPMSGKLIIKDQPAQ